MENYALDAATEAAEMTTPRFDDSMEALVAAIEGSVLWTRIKVGGYDDDRRRLDDLPWGYERRDKTYGDTDPVLPV